ncbi:MAG: hypothetical protein AAF402_16100 [Pseudomonadota bacterium]
MVNAETSVSMIGCKSRVGMLILGVIWVLPTASWAQSPAPLSRYDLYLYISDKTQNRDDRKIFYSESGRLAALYQGKCEHGKWSTTEEGALCWHVSGWGELPCEPYLSDGVSISVLQQGRSMPAPEIESGNRLECPLFGNATTLLTGVEPVEDFWDGLFNRKQTEDYLAGKTVVWGSGRGLYYADDFTLLKVWDGVASTGKWEVNENGAVCWHVPGWGPTPCESYYLKDGQLMVYLNKRHSQAAEHVVGNQIGNF